MVREGPGDNTRPGVYCLSKYHSPASKQDPVLILTGLINGHIRYTHTQVYTHMSTVLHCRYH